MGYKMGQRFWLESFVYKMCGNSEKMGNKMIKMVYLIKIWREGNQQNNNKIIHAQSSFSQKEDMNSKSQNITICCRIEPGNGNQEVHFGHGPRAPLQTEWGAAAEDFNSSVTPVATLLFGDCPEAFEGNTIVALIEDPCPCPPFGGNGNSGKKNGAALSEWLAEDWFDGGQDCWLCLSLGLNSSRSLF
jgi:hypothetical protein